MQWKTKSTFLADFCEKKQTNTAISMMINIAVDQRFTLTLVNIYGPNHDNKISITK